MLALCKVTKEISYMVERATPFDASCWSPDVAAVTAPPQ
jgi:hypothetical protein